MKTRKNKKGFTLVELVVVIAIIAILGAVSVVGYLGFVNNAKESTAKTEATQIRTVLLAGAADPDSGFELKNNTLVIDADAIGKTTATAEANDNDVLIKYYFDMTDDASITTTNLNEATDNNDDEVTSLIYTSKDSIKVIITFDNAEVSIVK